MTQEALKQEPVEWGVDWGKDGNSVSIIKRLADGNIEVLAWEYAPHPQRTWVTWVGLTDVEMEATFIECGGKWNGDFWKIEDADFHPFLRTIEAKLKERNT